MMFHMLNAIRLISRWEWLILLGLLPFFLFPDGARGLVVLVIPLFWIVRKIGSGHFFPATPFNLALLLMVIMVGLSSLASFELSLHLPKIIGLLLGIALFLAVTEFSRQHSLWPVVIVFCGLGFLIALLGIVGMEWLSPFDSLNRLRRSLPVPSLSVPGAVGGVINANELAGVLNWIAPLLLACLLGIGRRLWRVNKVALALLLLMTTLTALLLIGTQSRGGIFAYVIGAVLVVAFFLPSRWRIVLVIALAIGLFGLISYSRNSTTQIDLVGDTLGLSGRLEIWSRAFLAIADYPLTGVGMNGFRRVVNTLYPLFGISEEIDLGHAHNHLLQVALDLGLPGLVSYLALWIIGAGLLWQTARNLIHRHAKHHPYYAIVAGLAGSLAAGWVFGIFDTVALGARPSFIWWLLLGLTASVHYAVVYSGEQLRVHRWSASRRQPIVREIPPGERQRSPLD